MKRGRRLEERILAILLAVLMLVSMTDLGEIINVQAATGEFSTNGIKTDEQGKMTYEPAIKNSEGYYEIGNAGQLAWFANYVNTTDQTANGKLTKNIDLADVCHAKGNDYATEVSWIPIGLYASEHRYKGTFKGENHTISNLYINDSTATYQGLFGYIHTGGSVENVTLENVNITAKQYVGTIAGKNNSNDGGPATIKNCIVESGFVKGDTSLTGAEASGTVVGGIVGQAMGPVTSCRNNGVTVTGGSCVGGISGWNFHSKTNSYKTQITYCYNGGQVTGSNHTGAITGYIHDCSISECCLANNCFYLKGTASKAIGTDKSSIYNNNELRCKSLTSAEVAGTTLPHCLKWGIKYSDSYYHYHYMKGYNVIHDYLGKTTSVYVPSSIAGSPVSYIESNAFYGSNPGDIYLPDTIETIEDSAFTGKLTVHVSVTQNLSNVTSSLTEKYSVRNEECKIKLTPADGYKLPSSIRILHYKDELTEGTDKDYTYDSTTGEIVVKADKMDIGIAINASAKQVRNVVKFVNYKTNKEVATAMADSNNTITVPRDTIEKAGYSYSYYESYHEDENGNAEGTNFDIGEDDKVVLTETENSGTIKYVYVVETPKTTAVKYYNGTTELKDLDSKIYPKNYSYGDTVTFPAWSEDGYSFLGWYTNPEFTGNRVDSISGTSQPYKETMTLYARTCKHEFINGFCDKCKSYEAPAKNDRGYYEIDNAGKLYWFAALVNGELNGEKQTRYPKGVLTKDITINQNVIVDGKLAEDTSGFREWTPIGKSLGSDFAGAFNGNGHTIRGLYFNDSKASYVGLFGIEKTDSSYANNTVIVENVNIEDSYLKGKSFVGGILGSFESPTGSYVRNCSFNGIIEGEHRIGGIVGSLSSSGAKVYYCENKGKVEGISDSATDNYGVGGIVGNSSSGSVYYCYNKGEVSGQGNTYIGGISGYGGSVYYSCSIGRVNGTNAGGIIGYLGSALYIKNSYYQKTGTEGLYATSANDSKIINCAEKTTDQFASGEVTYLLNGASSTQPLYWYQNLGDANVDTVPVLNDWTHGVVNNVGTQDAPKYSNLWTDEIKAKQGESVTKEYNGTNIELSGEDFNHKGKGAVSKVDYYQYDVLNDRYIATGSYSSSGGAVTSGGAPKYAGTYYVKVTVDSDDTYIKTTSDYIKYEITKKTPTKEDLSYTAPSNLTYDGSGKVAAVNVAEGKKGMGTIVVTYKKLGELKYTESPTNAGTYDVYATITTSGNNYTSCSEIKVGQFEIVKADNLVSAKIESVFEGESLVPSSTATYGKAEYSYYTKSGDNYTKLKAAPTEAGTYYLQAWVAESDNYKRGTSSYVEFKIKKDTTICTNHKWSEWKVTKPATYDANGIETRTCSVCKKTETRAIPKLKKITVTSRFKITLSTSTYTYSGGRKTPSVVVKNPQGVTLKKGTNYDVTYAGDRKNVGKYSVKVTFKGSYTGSRTLYFTINPKKTSIKSLSKGKKSFKAKWSKISTQITGYQLRYSTSSKLKGSKTTTIKGYKKTSITVKKLKAKKKYYVQIRTYKKVGSKTYYSAWSKTKKVKTK
ncbi:MAG: MBG domain-containing protein [Anaerostipes sp.]|nr:MBG domain-containing protein [Anaerostipes sp.]